MKSILPKTPFSTFNLFDFFEEGVFLLDYFVNYSEKIREVD